MNENRQYHTTLHPLHWKNCRYANKWRIAYGLNGHADCDWR